MSITTNFFRNLFGFVESEYVSTQQQLLRICKFERKDKKERCLFEPPGMSYSLSSGWHSTPNIQELREETVEKVRQFDQKYPGVLASLRANQSTSERSTRYNGLAYRHIVGDAGDLHEQCPNALFQAASQFNLLEFISSQVVPEDGVTHYVYDHTQGPACALACMAGTAYRNYLIHPSLFHDEYEKKKGGDATEVQKVNEQDAPDPCLRGQRAAHQVNTLLYVEHNLAEEINRRGHESPYFQIRNGYFAPLPKLKYLCEHLKAAIRSQGGDCRTSVSALCDTYITSRLRVGLVEDATVTTPLHSTGSVGEARLHTVSQVYCSALSLPSCCSACRDSEEAESVALLATSVLKGAYEGTLLFGVQHSLRQLEKEVKEKNSSVEEIKLSTIFLTKVGGGVFNNKTSWIKEAIDHALLSVSEFGVPMDIALVHFRSIDEAYY